MRDEDAEFAANVIRLSLEQLLDASRGKINVKLYDDELLKSEPRILIFLRTNLCPHKSTIINLLKCLILYFMILLFLV